MLLYNGGRYVGAYVKVGFLPFYDVVIASPHIYVLFLFALSHLLVSMLM